MSKEPEKITPVERKRRALAADYDEFRAAYDDELRISVDGFVEARRLPLTGLILWELVSAGLAERDETAYRPLPWRDRK